MRDHGVEEKRAALKALATPERAVVSKRFFKTGLGEYGEGDIFIGVTVPVIRKLVDPAFSVEQCAQFVQSPIHEERLLGLLTLVKKFSKEPTEEIYRFYLDNTRFINNWDLVDLSAEHIVGPFLVNRPKDVLYELALSESLWERRISMLATFHFIKLKEFDEPLKIAKLLLHDTEDLIQKAVGWMLREIGKRHLPTEEAFLKAHYQTMPRTMLRYAIERFPEPIRKAYLKGEV